MIVVLDIDLRLRPNVGAPAEARRSLEALRPSLDDLLVDDAVLLVSEIVSNSVRHASLDASDAIEVRIRGSRSMLHVDVIDPGPGFDPGHVRPSPENGGWGLWLLDRLATRWGVERNHVTKVWFELVSSVSAARAAGT
jgi:anti-sigma regulatory factor (Ser/Thr protein kinase)